MIGASRFLTGLVTCFATHDGIPAVAYPSGPVCSAYVLRTCVSSARFVIPEPDNQTSRAT